MKKYLVSLASVALCFGLVSAIGGAASAHGGNKHGGSGVGYGYGNGNGHKKVVATGTTSCNFHGRLTISSSGAVRITGNITPKHGRACTSTGGTKLKTGHFSSALVSSTSTAVACVTAPVGALSDVSGGKISWSPQSKVAPSVGVALTGGTVSEVTVNGKQYVEIAYTGGSVASGSFAATSGVTLTARSNSTVSACRHGSYSISFKGTLTL